MDLVDVFCCGLSAFERFSRWLMSNYASLEWTLKRFQPPLNNNSLVTRVLFYLSTFLRVIFFVIFQNCFSYKFLCSWYIVKGNFEEQDCFSLTIFSVLTLLIQALLSNTCFVPSTGISESSLSSQTRTLSNMSCYSRIWVLFNGLQE